MANLTKKNIKPNLIKKKRMFFFLTLGFFHDWSSTHLNKLEVIQNKALSIVTDCHKKGTASHLRAETGVLPLRAHLELCSQQFYASALQSLHPSHLIVTSPNLTPGRPIPHPLGATLQA